MCRSKRVVTTHNCQFPGAYDIDLSGIASFTFARLLIFVVHCCVGGIWSACVIVHADIDSPHPPSPFNTRFVCSSSAVARPLFFVVAAAGFTH